MISATMVLDSISPCGVRLSTMEVVFPRPFLAQLNMHGIICKSAESSRAIPVAKRVAAVREAPYFPEHWGKNQRGMQSYAHLEGEEAKQAQAFAEAHLEHALNTTRQLLALGVHKQDANRYLEPFAYQKCLLTATEWQNFLNLRLHHAAQPAMQELARRVKACLDGSEPDGYRGWHLPYAQGIGWHGLSKMSTISAARCARMSYSGFDGTTSVDKDLALGQQLLQDGHMNPFEHQAMLVHPRHASTYIPSQLRAPWLQYRKELAGEAVFAGGEK